MKFLYAAMVAATAVLVAAAHVGGGAFKDTEAVVPMHALPLRRVADVEDVASFVKEEAAYPRRRVLYESQYASYNGLTENKAACYGSCPGRGQPYSGRGCLNIYRCKG